MEMSELSKKHDEDKIGLHEYWMIIMKKSVPIIAVCVISMIVAAIVSTNIPQVYNGDFIIKIGLANLPGKDLILYKSLLPENVNGTLKSIGTDTSKLLLSVRASSPEEVMSSMTSVIKQMNQSSIIQKNTEEQKRILTRRLNEYSSEIRRIEEMAKYFFRKKDSHVFAFNPVDMSIKLLQLKSEQHEIEDRLNKIHTSQVLLVIDTKISLISRQSQMQRNVILAGFVALFASVFFVIFVEFIRNKITKHPKNA